MSADSKVDRLLGSPPLRTLSSSLTANLLRVPAYHGVPDPAAFSRQLEQVLHGLEPVTGADVAAALHGGPRLPRHAVWITFDDGCADVVDAGLDVLDRFGVPATMFICPGLVEERRPFWWDQVLTAVTSAPYSYDGRVWTDRALVVHLKTVDDTERRRVVDDLAQRSEPPAELQRSVLTVDHATAWLGAGHEIGNHTWDHPCLDRCSDEEQVQQITRAHAAIADLAGRPPELFAYPNGDWAPAAERALEGLHYQVGLLFDHRLARISRTDPLRVSRLRLDSNASPARAHAIMSGAHSGLFQTRTRAMDRLKDLRERRA